MVLDRKETDWLTMLSLINWTFYSEINQKRNKDHCLLLHFSWESRISSWDFFFLTIFLSRNSQSTNKTLHSWLWVSKATFKFYRPDVYFHAVTDNSLTDTEKMIFSTMNGLIIALVTSWHFLLIPIVLFYLASQIFWRLDSLIVTTDIKERDIETGIRVLVERNRLSLIFKLGDTKKQPSPTDST